MSERPAVDFRADRNEDEDSDASTERPTTQRTVTFDDAPTNSAPVPSKTITGLGRIRTSMSRQNSKDSGRLLDPPTANSLMQHSNISSTHIEDLETFPTTSLHSFSFAAQHDTIAARHNIVQRSLDYLRDRIIGGQKRAGSHEADDSSRRGSETKAPAARMTLDLTGVNDNAFDPSRVPPQTAPIPHALHDDMVDSGHSSQLTSGQVSPHFGSRSTTTTTSGTSSHSIVALPRNRALSFSEKYPDMRRQLQSSLSCTNLPNLNPYYQTSPLQPYHPTNRWGQQISQAVFTTSLEEPWNIQSANDYAMMIFGMGRDAIRKKSLVEYVVEDRRDWLRLKLGETRKNKFAEGQVLLCGDVIPVIKRLGTGAASLWIKEKTNGLVWVIEEIEEGVCTLAMDARDELITAAHGEAAKVFERDVMNQKLTSALPTLPRDHDGLLQLDEIKQTANYTLKSASGDIPCTVEPSIFSQEGKHSIRVSFLPHVAGIIVVSADTLTIKSANPVFTSSLLGLKETTGQHINTLIPNFEEMMQFLLHENDGEFTEGQVIPELAFRDAARSLTGAAADMNLRGIESRHRDGATVFVDIQMRISVVQTSASPGPRPGHFSFAGADREDQLLALWISYEKGLTPKAQDEVLHTAMSRASKAVVPSTSSSELSSPVCPSDPEDENEASLADLVPRDINEYQIMEEMGAGAYGQVKLARYGRKRQRVVLKYVTKSRILVDTWTRDRKLGTVPLEIHVLHHLKSHQHRNLVEMKDFFEDDTNYYIVMAAHTPGMDLFDYIELNTSMSEWECKCISLQVAKALEHLHSLDIVHRDIKDENVVLDRNGWVKLIDFGSANYCRNGPFDTFHGTLDYASPEALDGKPYMGKEQDVWACGILFYTLIYKENPFYNIDEIMDRDLRVPYIVSERSIDLIRRMLNRTVPDRSTMKQVLEHEWYKDCVGDVQEKVKIDMPQR